MHNIYIGECTDIICMRCVTINKELRKMIVDESDGTESVNETVRRLVNEAEKPKHQINMKRTTIKLDEDVLKGLEELKIYKNESYTSVITRLINSKK